MNIFQYSVAIENLILHCGMAFILLAFCKPQNFASRENVACMCYMHLYPCNPKTDNAQRGSRIHAIHIWCTEITTVGRIAVFYLILLHLEQLFLCGLVGLVTIGELWSYTVITMDEHSA